MSVPTRYKRSVQHVKDLFQTFLNNNSWIHQRPISLHHCSSFRLEGKLLTNCRRLSGLSRFITMNQLLELCQSTENSDLNLSFSSQGHTKPLHSKVDVVHTLQTKVWSQGILLTSSPLLNMPQGIFGMFQNSFYQQHFWRVVRWQTTMKHVADWVCKPGHQQQQQCHNVTSRIFSPFLE